MVKKTKKKLKEFKSELDRVKFLKSMVEDLINKPAVPIVDLLSGKKHVNEFFIAKKLGLTINQTRNILYKLSDFGLVSFTRKKDSRKGWYIYFWTLNTYKSLDLLEKNLQDKIAKLNEQLRDRREKRYYFCKNCSIEVSEEEALLNNFICPECEEVYVLMDNKDIISQIERDILKVKKDLDLVSAERSKEGSKIEKKRIKKIEKVKAEKKQKKVVAMMLRRKVKKAEKKKLERKKLERKEARKKKSRKKKIIKKKKK